MTSWFGMGLTQTASARRRMGGENSDQAGYTRPPLVWRLAMQNVLEDDGFSSDSRRRTRNVHLAMAVTGVVVGCIYGTRPLVALQAYALGASPLDIGMLTSAFSLLPAALIVPLAHRTRHMPLNLRVLLATTLASAGLALPYVIPGVAGLYASQLVSGLCFAVVLVVTVAFIEENSSRRTRNTNVARYMIGNAIGTFVGPSVAGLIAEIWTHGHAFLAASAVGIAMSASGLWLKMGDSHRSSVPGSSSAATRDLLKRPDLRGALYVSALVLTAKDMYVAYFPLVGKEIGLSTATIGMIISVNALAGIFIRWFMPKLTAGFGRDAVLGGSFVLSGVFFAVQPLFHEAAILTVISFLLGLGLGIGQPISISATLAALPKEHMSTGLGLRIMVNRVSQVSAPFVFGTMAQLAGTGSIFVSFGAIFLIGGAWRIAPRKSGASPADDS